MQGVRKIAEGDGLPKGFALLNKSLDENFEQTGEARGSLSRLNHLQDLGILLDFRGRGEERRIPSDSFIGLDLRNLHQRT
jgi:hypothetical protein